MSTPASLVAGARSLIEANPDLYGLIDRCELIGPSFVDGGAAGDSVTCGAITTNIPCLREPAGQSDQIVVGGETFLATDRIFMIKQDETEAITPRYKIRVFPEDGSDALVFQNPMKIDETLNPLVVVKAVIVKQGYQQ